MCPLVGTSPPFLTSHPFASLPKGAVPSPAAPASLEPGAPLFPFSWQVNSHKQLFGIAMGKPNQPKLDPEKELGQQCLSVPHRGNLGRGCHLPSLLQPGTRGGGATKLASPAPSLVDLV